MVGLYLSQYAIRKLWQSFCLTYDCSGPSEHSISTLIVIFPPQTTCTRNALVNRAIGTKCLAQKHNTCNMTLFSPVRFRSGTFRTWSKNFTTELRCLSEFRQKIWVGWEYMPICRYSETDDCDLYIRFRTGKFVNINFLLTSTNTGYS